VRQLEQRYHQQKKAIQVSTESKNQFVSKDGVCPKYSLLNSDQRICGYFSRCPEVVAVYLFGSQAKGKARNRSDIDIAILLEDGSDSHRYFDLMLKHMEELERIYNNRVDVVILNNARPLLQHQVLMYGKLLYERNRQARVRFEVSSRKIYFDIKPALEEQSKALFKRIKEVGLSGRYRGNRDALEDVSRLRQKVETFSKDDS
jgi:predicted nucleotidyltransferase